MSLSLLPQSETRPCLGLATDLTLPPLTQGEEDEMLDLIDPAVRHAILHGRDILCISHIAPDGDALGSLLGMGWLLRRLGKAPVLALQDPVPIEHRTLPGAGAILSGEMPEFEAAVRQRRFDLIICLDSSSPDRMGTAYNAPAHETAMLVVIDHHVTNTRFGRINWVDPASAAVCQMLTRLAEAMGVALDGELAECLLTGIVTDTLCFRTGNTTPEVLGAAMRLMQGGANLATITARTVNRRSFNLIRLWGRALAEVYLEDGVIWAAVSRDDLEATGNGVGEISLSSFLVTADEADISAFFMEKAGAGGEPTVECSFRAKPGFDVSRLAYELGGGGHPAASGCTVPGSLCDVVATVTLAMKAARRSQAESGVGSGGIEA